MVDPSKLLVFAYWPILIREGLLLTSYVPRVVSNCILCTHTCLIPRYDTGRKMSLELSHEATAAGLKTPGRKLPLAVKLFKTFSVLADSVLRFGRVRVRLD